MLKLNPVFKDYIWGGDKLKTLYHKKSDLEVMAESWELSTHKDGQCKIAEGAHEKETLANWIKGKNFLGSKAASQDDLPILIKLIDAKDNLSVQVHPDDDYALTNEGDFGKTEMWYVLEAEEDARLVYGFKKDISKEAFEQHIIDNTLTEVLNSVPVKKGDVFFINPGTMHAIGKGIMIAEIQQSSNVTYRVYDYGRVGVDGKPRELHVEKALQVTHLKKADKAKVDYNLEKHEGYSRGVIAACKYFTVELVEIEAEAVMHADHTTFHSLLILEGDVRIYSHKDTLYAAKGESIFIPASYGDYKIEGSSKIILSTL
ncbi:type I phosphomannose isomerase catalytic subunit [Cellulosilyticum sp. I15G10I2]|uniref:type I phosphomannose isomerase catalytic subunit n=1 Tax=Cellulosilyticum sp. I15G10I2 TaxID=1892843 RepID=UPI00085CD51A|nr:type I phosphomannose isomerase catalytic subunit [Cellulosilyticum sp. I15G10I2]